jgi:hypothetical protein
MKDRAIEGFGQELLERQLWVFQMATAEKVLQ